MSTMHRLALLALVALPLLTSCGRVEPSRPKPTIAPPPGSAPAVETAPASPAATAPTASAPQATAAGGVGTLVATPEVLAEYNRRLQAWVERTSYLPKRFEELHTLAGDCPRPPKAPPGQRLVFDPKTVSVQLE